MTEAEIEVVAEELAKLGGTAWYPGRGEGPILRVVHQRYRDRAKAAIAALDRYRASNAEAPSSPELSASDSTAETDPVAHEIKLGTRIVYRPPGDQRAYPCTVEKIRDGFAYLAPENRTGIAWVPVGELSGLKVSDDGQAESLESNSTVAK